MHIDNRQIALSPSPGQLLLLWWQTALDLLQIWQERRYQREKLHRLLRHLNAAQLHDIGIDIHEARFERNKPFWQA